MHGRQKCSRGVVVTRLQAAQPWMCAGMRWYCMGIYLGGWCRGMGNFRHFWPARAGTGMVLPYFVVGVVSATGLLLFVVQCSTAGQVT